MDEATKDQLMAAFRAHLDRAGTLDDPDAAPEAETAPDLFTLLAELAALRNEVKLESRQVKSALDEFRSLFDALRESGARLGEEQERRREQERLADQQGQKDLLLDLLDLRDRLQAGQEQARRFRPGWFDGRATAFIVSMAEGLEMNLRRFDETLARRGVTPLRTLDQPFDPHTMHAAELVNWPARPAGIVVRELRKGFLLHDRLLRPAEVAVNRPSQRHDPNTSPEGVWPLA
ncbi:nucleotide exchange factor GrpE [Thiobaca trueperi]|uniref:Protein GrpE n=1 Tax=Thiobaca trueperi TaxID=127458 RepID=A0A4R3N743_9GAMM|nr:nucleotide exchange factor GrpE [Thiobaca trueperi]TCT24221.1 molecular chaperone GrpE [Thiobaca trueperi]